MRVIHPICDIRQLSALKVKQLQGLVCYTHESTQESYLAVFRFAQYCHLVQDTL